MQVLSQYAELIWTIKTRVGTHYARSSKHFKDYFRFHWPQIQHYGAITCSYSRGLQVEEALIQTRKLDLRDQMLSHNDVTP